MESLADGLSEGGPALSRNQSLIGSTPIDPNEPIKVV